MAKPEGGLLAGETRLTRLRQVTVERFQLALLAAHFQRVLEFKLAVEMVFDDALVAARHEDEELDAGSTRLVHHMLDDRPVDDGQHFLGHRLGGGQEPGAEAGDGEHGLADLGGLGTAGHGRRSS